MNPPRPLPRSRAAFCIPVALLAASAATAQVDTLVSPNSNVSISNAFGHSLAAVRDVDGDGVPDLIVGAPEDHVPGSGIPMGRAYVFSGTDRSLLHTFTLPVPSGSRTAFGTTVAGLWNTLGDGRGDIAVSAPHQAAPPGGNVIGRVHVYSGATGGWLYEVVDTGSAFACGLVQGIDALPDLDGDGLPELGVMASFLGCTHLRVYRGGGSELLFQTPGPDPWRVVAFRDVDGDGVTDLAVAVRGLRRIHIISGATGELLWEIRHPDPQHPYWFGQWVDVIQDLDGDGLPDILVNGDELIGPIVSGVAYVFSGADGALIRMIPPPFPRLASYFGNQIVALPDVDGDGREDILVTAFHDSAPGLPQQCGMAYIFSGATGGLLRTLRSPNAQYLGRFGWWAVRLLEERPNRRASFAISTPYEWNDRGRVYIFAACRADADANGAIDSRDISRFINGWITTLGVPPSTLPPPGVHHGDFNDDGAVNSADLAAFITEWLAAVQAGGCP